MNLRTRTSHPVRTGATSGPGRSPRSDGRGRGRSGGHEGGPGRARGRGPGGGRFRDWRPQPDPVLVRRRAEALLAAPPDPAGSGAVVRGAPLRAGPEAESQPEPASGTPPSELGPGPEAGEGVGLDRGAALRLAVRERLPGWLQARCGVEPRTVAAVAVVLVAATGFAAQQYWSAKPQPVTAPAVIAPAPSPAPAPGPPAAAPGAGTRVVVDVSGKVREPGLRRLPAGSRVEDALAAAGGVRPGTDTSGLNRARVLVDGEQVVVGAPPQPSPEAGGSGPASGPLSLGSATVAQLDGLPGVGPVLAQHIVDFRTARGGFRSVDELRQVNGIGERRFSDLRKLVRP